MYRKTLTKEPDVLQRYLIKTRNPNILHPALLDALACSAAEHFMLLSMGMLAPETYNKIKEV